MNGIQDFLHVFQRRQGYQRQVEGKEVRGRERGEEIGGIEPGIPKTSGKKGRSGEEIVVIEPGIPKTSGKKGREGGKRGIES